MGELVLAVNKKFREWIRREDSFSVKRVNGKKVKTRGSLFRQRSLFRIKNSKTRIGKEL